MDCPYALEVPITEYFADKLPALREQRVPLVGSLELTWRCNLRCAHCYITAAESWAKVVESRAELTTADWLRTIDEIAEAGCLWLLVTGGEPLLRKDFVDIYLHAKRRGMLITLFTNGTLLDEALVELLSEWPPRAVEITLYGSIQETYERVTGVSGSFARCMRCIDSLMSNDIPLSLKTMVMTLNQHELLVMRQYAEGLGVKFRYDPTLNACMDGSRAPLGLRLTPQQVVALDRADPDRLEGWRSYLDRFRGAPTPRSTLFSCGAGINGFHVDPYGQLSICMMVRQYTYDLKCGSFQDGWTGYSRDIRFKSPGKGFPCQDCQIALLCDQCPGWAHLESGNDTSPVEYLCEIAHLRARALGAGPLAQVLTPEALGALCPA